MTGYGLFDLKFSYIKNNEECLYDANRFFKVNDNYLENIKFLYDNFNKSLKDNERCLDFHFFIMSIDKQSIISHNHFIKGDNIIVIPSKFKNIFNEKDLDYAFDIDGYTLYNLINRIELEGLKLKYKFPVYLYKNIEFDL